MVTLPASIADLKELRQIDLRGNPLESLPDCMAELPKLEKLDLRWVSSLRAPKWLNAFEKAGGIVYR